MTKREAIRQTAQENTLLELGFTRDEATQLRRISLTLHRWFEHECNGTIQRDGDNGDGEPYWYNTTTGRKIGKAPDRERGAMKRLQTIIAARNDRIKNADRDDITYGPNGGILRPYIQSDPRGASLYILRPGDVPKGQDAASCYNRGVCVY